MGYKYKDNGERNTAITTAKRIVIKVGTRLLTDISEQSKAERIKQLISEIAILRNQGYEILLVSSGAIGAGMIMLNTTKRPTSLPILQAHAATGQSRLMYLYEDACSKHDFHCAQLLLTSHDVTIRKRHLNITSCINALLSKGVLPIINENDSVSIEEIQFGDNDKLAAMTATMMQADLTILLTTIDGLYDRNENGTLNQRISVVSSIQKELYQMAEGTDGNKFSIGGMITKLNAAQLICKSGNSMWIADGRKFNILQKIVAKKDVGTLFTPNVQIKMNARKRFLAFFAVYNGTLIVDQGAEKALCKKGYSLLPTGICGISGNFKRGDIVRIVNIFGKEIARGTTYYNAQEVAKINGHQSKELAEILGVSAFYKEVVHRNNLVLTTQINENSSDDNRKEL